jgi:hypothetical protein
VILGVWLSLNKMVFQGLELYPAQIAHKIRSAINGNSTSSKEKLTRVLKEPKLNYEQLGDSLMVPVRKPQVCGAGAILYLNQ